MEAHIRPRANPGVVPESRVTRPAGHTLSGARSRTSLSPLRSRHAWRSTLNNGLDAGCQSRPLHNAAGRPRARVSSFHVHSGQIDTKASDRSRRAGAKTTASQQVSLIRLPRHAPLPRPAPNHTPQPWVVSGVLSRLYPPRSSRTTLLPTRIIDPLSAFELFWPSRPSPRPRFPRLRR